jgi:hypothetical protein
MCCASVSRIQASGTFLTTFLTSWAKAILMDALVAVLTITAAGKRVG